MNNISVEPINNNVVVEVSAPKDSVSVSFYPTENPQIYSELAKKYCDDAAYFSNNAVAIIKDTVDNIENGLVNSINAVADDLTNIDAVNSNKTNIDLIAGNLVNINAVAADLTNINNASVSATSALNSAGLAQDWASKTSGKVDGSEYSAKYYAEQAAQSASQAAAEQVNPDWNENDNTKKSYILNKPAIPSVDNFANKDLSNLSTIGATKILPSQTGNSGKYLITDGSSASWATVGSALADLSDVQVTSLANNDVIMYNSTDTKFKNVRTAECHVVIESYQNGTSWYRIYDDGWCEQGGYQTQTTTTANATTFLKAFRDTNYVLLIGNDSNTGNFNYNNAATNKSTTGFTFYVTPGTTNYTFGSWYVCGYLADGEY